VDCAQDFWRSGWKLAAQQSHQTTPAATQSQGYYYTQAEQYPDREQPKPSSPTRRKRQAYRCQAAGEQTDSQKKEDAV